MEKKFYVKFEYDDNPHEFTASVDVDDDDSEPVILGKLLTEITKEAEKIYGGGGHGAFRSLKVYEEISE